MSSSERQRVQGGEQLDPLLCSTLNAIHQPLLLCRGDGASLLRNVVARRDFPTVTSLYDAVESPAELVRLLAACKSKDRPVRFAGAEGSALAGVPCSLRAVDRRGQRLTLLFEINVAGAGCDRADALRSQVVQLGRDLRSAIDHQRDERQQRQALEQRNRELVRTSQLDPLTQVRNRRGLQQEFRWALRDQHREQTELSVFAIDLDRFKDINDRYGHSAGDDCLQRIAWLLRRACRRPRDIVARQGGDEFTLVLPQTDREGAVRVAERIQQQLRDGPKPARPGLELSLSMGICVLHPTRLWTQRAVFEAADRALYRAKRSGRDCYEVTTLPDPDGMPNTVPIGA